MVGIQCGTGSFGDSDGEIVVDKFFSFHFKTTTILSKKFNICTEHLRICCSLPYTVELQ